MVDMSCANNAVLALIVFAWVVGGGGGAGFGGGGARIDRRIGGRCIGD